MNEIKKETEVVEAEVVEESTPEVSSKEIVEANTEPKEDNLAPVDENLLDDMTKQLLDLNADYGSSELLIDSIDKDEVETLQQLSEGLNVPITELSNGEDTDSAKVGNSLLELKGNIEEILPSNNTLEDGFFAGIISKITGNSAMNKYLAKFKTVNEVIDGINDTLERGKISLRESNVIYLDDKTKYRETTKSLNNKVNLLRHLDSKVEEKINSMEEGSEDRSFLETEVLFPLRNKVQDTQQLLAVTAQGVLGLDVLIRNNKELITSVKRTQTLTMTALRIGALVAAGLSQQGKVLKAVKSTNETTSNIIANNGKMLKEQGTSIQKQAASAMLSMDKLNDALKDTVQAIEDIESFKRDALPGMKESVEKLQTLNDTMERSITKIENGDKLNTAGKITGKTE